MSASQINEAVKLALLPNTPQNSQLKQQAHEFLLNVDSNIDNYVEACLELITQPELPDATQFFAYDLILKFMLKSDIEKSDFLRVKLWDRILNNTLKTPKHILNKQADMLKMLFVRLYENLWPTFFDDLFNLLNIQFDLYAELYTSTLLAIHLQIGDQLFGRSGEELQLANKLKDLVRVRDASKIIENLGSLLRNPTSSTNLIIGVLNCISGWVVWTEMSLVLPVVPCIAENILKSDEVTNASVLALVEIMSKKMNSQLKLELIQQAKIGETLTVLQSHPNKSPEFEESCAKLLNSVLFECAHSLNDLPLNQSTVVHQQLEQIIADMLDLVVTFFLNEFDDTSAQLIPGIQEYLTFIRKSLGKNDKQFTTNYALTPERAERLRKLLYAFIIKSRFDKDDYTLSNGEDDVEPEFEEFRAKLKILQETIAKIDFRLFLEVCGGRISKTLTAFGATNIVTSSQGKMNINFDLNSLPNVNTSDWTELELALYELSIFNEFSRMWVSKTAKFGGEWVSAANEIQSLQFQLFEQMILAGSTLNVWNHPSVQLLYMDMVHRYAPQFLVEKGELVQKLLSLSFDFFLKYGVQNSELKVRVRSWYLFYRLLRAVRRTVFMTDTSVGEMVSRSIAPLLLIEVNSVLSEDLNIAVQQDTLFTSQLYLYEVCGILFAVGKNDIECAELMRQLLSAMFDDINTATTNGDNLNAAQCIRVHHNIVALSAVSKGLGETVQELPSRPRDALDEQLAMATKMVVAVADKYHSVPVIKDACRQALSRILGVLGSKVLVEVSAFINTLLGTFTPDDVGEFLSFLGQLIHKFDKDPQVFEMFVSLTNPLFTKLFEMLSSVAQRADVEEVGSTDAQLLRRDATQHYMQYVYNLVNNSFGAVLFLNGNEQVFQLIYNSLLHYAANGDVKGGSGSPANQKTAIVVLTKFISIWGPTGKVPDGHFAAQTDVPIISLASTYEQLTNLCWTLPAGPTVNFGDAQTRMVVTELAGLQKIMFEVRGASYIPFFQNYLNQAGLEPALIEELCSKLNAPAKDFKMFFYQFLKRALSK